MIRRHRRCHHSIEGVLIFAGHPRLQALWHSHREKMLYLVVGGWNTLFTWLSFSLLYYFLSPYVYSSLILVASYLIASVNGFLGFRYIVFGASGRHPLLEYIKYQVVYLPLLGLNMVILPLLLAHTTWNAYIIEAGFGALSIVVGYLGNKYFTFRRRRPTPQQDAPGATEAAGDPSQLS